MPPVMRVDLFFLVLFILYCLEAGLFLVLAPWNAGWDRLAFRMPFELLRELLLSPYCRGAVTGFGLIHLMWGLHDLRWLLVRQRRLRQRLAADGAAGPHHAPAAERPPAAEPPAAPPLRDAG
jgi:hypothetical protein